MSKGMPSLQGFRVEQPKEYNVEEFTESEDNVNAHSDIDLNATANSMEQFGQVETLVVDLKNKKVIGGNGRLRKMKEKGWKTFWAYGVEGSEDQITTLAVTLNKTGRLSDFDYAKLTMTLQQLQHADDPRLLALTGFQQHELEPLLASEMHLPDVESAVPAQEEKKPKSTKDLDARGMTLQFSMAQKQVLDVAINKIRSDTGDFSVTPMECITNICREYISEEPEDTPE